MKIGVVGLGVVGRACKQGFLSQGHEILEHDILLGTALEHVLTSDIIYICVPTPMIDDRILDQSEVEKIIYQLDFFGYQGVVAIKSTILPGTTDRLGKEVRFSVCFVPEFLRERCAVEDFVDNHHLLAIGSQDAYVQKLVIESHGSLPKNIRILKPIEAEILKYYNNTFNAVRIVFANLMYELCVKNNADYNLIKESYLLQNIASDHYMDCNQSLRGFGGMCLPKDIKTLADYLEKNNINFDLFKAVYNDNKKLKTTVFEGMRK